MDRTGHQEVWQVKLGRGNFFEYIVSFDYINTNSLNFLDVRKGEKKNSKRS